MTLGDERPALAVTGKGKAAGPRASDRPEQGDAHACPWVLEETLGGWGGRGHCVAGKAKSGECWWEEDPG